MAGKKAETPKGEAKAAKAEKAAKPKPAVKDASVLKKADLVDRLAAATEVKKRDVKVVTDALLDLLAARLEAGDTLQLPPLGRLKAAKSRALGDGSVMTVKIRRKDAATDASDTLAEPEE